jgi:hypothetical protein
VALEIGRGGDQNAARGRQPFGDQARIVDRAVPDHGIETVRCSLHKAIVEIERQVDAGMFGKKGVERRSQVQPAEADWRRYPQRPGERSAALGDLGCSFTRLEQDALCTWKKASAVLRERQLARCSLDEACTERSLEFGQSFAHD